MDSDTHKAFVQVLTTILATLKCVHAIAPEENAEYKLQLDAALAELGKVTEMLNDKR